MNENGKKFYGKYRATVVTNIDPLRLGRLLVEVPDVLGSDPCIWAVASAPLAGKGSGVYMVPAMGAGVWVHFEGGDPNSAVWDGCWRGDQTEIPPIVQSAPPATPPIVLGTITQNNIVISDAPMAGMVAGGIMLKSGASMIIVAPDGIKIIAPKIEILGLTNVNQGALIVT
jgi:hypothetical protein